MDVSLLGSLEVRRDGRNIDLGPPQARVFLAILATEANRNVAVSRLVDELWPDDPPRAAVSTIQTQVARLRASDAILRERLTTAGDGYRLTLGTDELDVSLVSELLARAEEADGAASRRRLLQEALGYWRGPAYGELAERSPLLSTEATRLEELRLTGRAAPLVRSGLLLARRAVVVDRSGARAR